MRTRLYIPGTADARLLDGILGPDHDVLLGRDRIVVATGDNNEPAGCLVWRPTAFIHQFDLPPTLGQLSVADDLFKGAVQLDFNRRHLIRQALFLVDSSNARMLRYVREQVHATEQPGVLFTLNLQAPGETK